MRERQEDAWVADSERGVFGVFDGHRGQLVAHFLRDRFANTLRRHESQAADKGAALLATFDELSDHVLDDPALDHQGSTGVAVLLDGRERIWTANLGDSRAVLCRGGQALNITTDHRPDTSDERARIEALGGNVRWVGLCGPERRPVKGLGVFRINGNLAVSRAFGDKDNSPLISHVPDIRCFEREAALDEFIILGSDGLWDVIDSQDAVNFVRHVVAGSLGKGEHYCAEKGSRSPKQPANQAADCTLHREHVAQYLVEEAVRCGSLDNVTCLVVWLTTGAEK